MISGGTFGIHGLFGDSPGTCWSQSRLVIGPLLDRLKSAQGHIVMHVAPGGYTFRVIILNDL